MLELFDNPAIPVVFFAVAAALVLGLIGRVPHLAVLASLAPSAAFLAAYGATYQKIPGFPPAGATNKIFYCCVFTLLAALLLDRLPASRIGRSLAAGVASIASTLWIGWPRLTQVDGPLVLTLIALSITGAITIGWLLEVADNGSEHRMGPAIGAEHALARLAAISSVFAPVALFGGSSTSVALCLGLAMALALLSLLALAVPREIGVTGILPGGIGILAVIDTVVLITQRADVLGLLLVAASPCLGWLALHILSPRFVRRPWSTWFAGGLASLLPLPAVVALLFLTHENPF